MDSNFIKSKVKYKILSCNLIFILFIISSYALLPSLYFNEKIERKDKNILYSSSDINSLKFNALNAYNYINTQLNFGYRVPGTQDHVECGNWIEGEIEKYSDMVQLHEFEIQKSGQPSYSCKNILGKINPNEEKIVIFGAHWDSRNVAEKDSTNRYSPIPGANDGASGVAVLLELARVLYSIKDQIDAQIWILFIDAEDQGESYGIYGLQGWNWCEGSKKFNQDIGNFYNSTKESFECFVLLDMVGGTDLKFIDESHSNNELQSKVFEIGRELGYTNAFPSNPKTMSIIDDHIYFINNGIPSLDLIIDFINGAWNHHHKHSDDLSNIDADSLNITGRTVELFVKNYYVDVDTGLNNNNGEYNWSNGVNEGLSEFEYLMIAIGLTFGVIFLGMYVVRKILEKKARSDQKIIDEVKE